VKGRTEALLFYACLAAGCWLFGGVRAAAVLVLVVAAGNRTAILAGNALRLDGPAGFSLAVRSLLVLGSFPFAWLACRFLPDGWLIPALGAILAAGAALSLRCRPPLSEPVRSGHGGVLFAFILVVATTYVPFSRIGAPVDGAYAFRAYFSSDYLKHFSVVEALNGGPVPPANPHFAGEPLPYHFLP
jgi:hypothetical protein